MDSNHPAIQMTLQPEAGPVEAGVETLHMTDVTFLYKVRSNVTDGWERRVNEGQRRGRKTGFAQNASESGHRRE